MNKVRAVITLTVIVVFAAGAGSAWAGPDRCTDKPSTTSSTTTLPGFFRGR